MDSIEPFVSEASGKVGYHARAMIKIFAKIAALVLSLVVAKIYIEKKISRPVGASDLSMFLEVRPQPSKIRRFVHEEKVYVEVSGRPTISTLSQPSDPLAYIFDDTGKLVEWTYDRCDSPPFVKRWGALSNATFISVKEAKHLVKSGSIPPRPTDS